MKRILARLFLQGVRDLGLNPWAQISTLVCSSRKNSAACRDDICSASAVVRW